jgi:glycerol-3-phosphate cytidylyltransferase-like family protein
MHYWKFSEIRNEHLNSNWIDQKPIICDSDFLGIWLKRKKIKKNMLDNNEISKIFNDLNKATFNDDHEIDHLSLFLAWNKLIIQENKSSESVVKVKRGEVANILNQSNMVVEVQYNQWKEPTKKQDIVLLSDQAKSILAEYCNALKKYAIDISVERLENIIALCEYEEDLKISKKLFRWFLKTTQYQFGYGKIKH